MNIFIPFGQPNQTNVVKVTNGKAVLVPNKPAHAKPVFIDGPVPDLVLTQGVLMTPVDYSVYFAGNVDSYLLSTVFTGLHFDTATGILSGTPTNLGGANPYVGATNVYGFVDSNLFSMSVVAP